MKAPAHIATGLTFTGILCSIYDINIFQSYTNTAVCVLCALIPDVDTTNSMLGKVLYPISKFINRKFGHRTITHSLLFVLFVPFVPKVLLYFNIIQNPDLTMIASFAVLSHVVLDMFSLSGIQFFYPFLRNSCVIPANPNHRFTVGDLKSELIVTGVCGILAITMQPLFINGFWTSYNRAFGTIKHVHRENNNTDSYTLCDYSYIDNNVTREGTAIVIESQTNEIIMFDKGQVIVLNADNPQIKVNYTKPRPSTIPKRYEYIQFFGLTLDSIQSLMRNNLVTGLIQSNYNVQYTDKAITYNTNFINLKNKYNFHIIAMTDTATRRNQELAELLAAQEEEQRRYRRLLQEYNTYLANVSNIENALLSTSLTNYERNRLQNELIRLRNQRKEPPRYEPSIRTQVRIDELRRAIDDRNLQFSGYLTIYQIVDPSLPEIRKQYREIEENFFAEIQPRKSVFANK